MDSVNIGNKDDGVKWWDKSGCYIQNKYDPQNLPLSLLGRSFSRLRRVVRALKLLKPPSYAGQDFLDRRFFKSSFLVLHIYNIVFKFGMIRKLMLGLFRLSKRPLKTHSHNRGRSGKTVITCVITVIFRASRKRDKHCVESVLSNNTQFR